MEQRKQQFFIFAVILLVVGFLQYFRRIISGYKLSRNGKILYLSTMITFTSAVIYLLYYTEMNNIVSFCIGLVVATTSEHMAKFFMVLGDNFNPIVNKLLIKYFKIDLTEEIVENENCRKKEDKNKKPQN